MAGEGPNLKKEQDDIKQKLEELRRLGVGGKVSHNKGFTKIPPLNSVQETREQVSIRVPRDAKHDIVIAVNDSFFPKSSRKDPTQEGVKPKNRVHVKNIDAGVVDLKIDTLQENGRYVSEIKKIPAKEFFTICDELNLYIPSHKIVYNPAADFSWLNEKLKSERHADRDLAAVLRKYQVPDRTYFDEQLKKEVTVLEDILKLAKETNQQDLIAKYTDQLEYTKKSLDKVLAEEKTRTKKILINRSHYVAKPGSYFYDSLGQPQFTITGVGANYIRLVDIKNPNNVIRISVDYHHSEDLEDFLQIHNVSLSVKKHIVDKKPINQTNTAPATVTDSKNSTESTTNTHLDNIFDARVYPLHASTAEKVAFIIDHSSMSIDTFSDDDDPQLALIATYESNRSKIAQMIFDGKTIAEILKAEHYNNVKNPKMQVDAMTDLAYVYALKLPDGFISDALKQRAEQIRMDDAEKMRMRKEKSLEYKEYNVLRIAHIKKLYAEKGIDLSNIADAEFPQTELEWDALYEEWEKIKDAEETAGE